MFLYWWLTITLLVFLLLCFRRSRKYAPRIPNGPQGFPFFGNLPQFVNNPHLKFSEWAKQYGSMYTIHVGTQPVLVINDVKIMREIFGTFESTGMYTSEVIGLLYEGPWGLLNSEGHQSLEQRRFCIKAMKEQGFGNANLLDPRIMNEVDDLCDLIDKKLETGENVHLRKMFMRATSNTIWNIITGEKIKSGELQAFHVLEQWVTTLNKATTRGFAFLPWLKYVVPDFCGYTDYYKACQDLRHLTKIYFKHQRETRKIPLQTSTATNLISAYLAEIEGCTDASSPFYGERGMNHGLSSAMAFLIGGGETTASTLTWLIFYLVMNPKVQEKLQKEIDNVVGHNRDPTVTDRTRMPYADAVITETLRFCSLAPFGIPHRLIGDLNYEGYTLPKGMFLLANMYHANHDPDKWICPDIFQPERFIAEGSVIRKELKDCVTSFQEGKRKCPGEQLAKDSLFLFTTKLFKKYSFYPAKDVNILEYNKPLTGMLLAPPDLCVVVKQRLSCF